MAIEVIQDKRLEEDSALPLPSDGNTTAAPVVTETPQPPTGTIYDALLQHVKACFMHAESARRTQHSNIEKRLQEAKMRRSGLYTAEQETLIKQQGQQPYFLRHTTTKCNHAEAVLEEIEQTISNRSWSIDPTPAPDVPDDLRQRAHAVAMTMFSEAMQAGQLAAMTPEQIQDLVDEMIDKQDSETMRLSKRRTSRAEKKIRDHLMAVGYDDVYEDVRSDGVTCGTGILKGPVMRHVKRLTYKPETSEPVVIDEPMAVAERVDPIDFYPEPSIAEIEDGYVIEKYRCGRQSLAALVGVPGYIDDSIRNILLNHKEHTVYAQSDSDRTKAEDKDWHESQIGQFDIFEFWGTVPGQYLKQAGIEIEDESGEYAYQVIWCANQIIKLVKNPHPLGRKPYQVYRYKKRPGSFWGDGVPELMRDKQDFINAAGRSLAVNVSMIPLPQIEVDKNRFVDGQDYTKFRPGKIWVTRNGGMLTVPGVRFNSIPSQVDSLLTVKREFEKDSDDSTGVQPFTYGNSQVAGAGRTASGQAQLTQLAMRGIKQTIRSLDKMKSCFIKELYTWYVMHSADEDFKGDAQVTTRGTLGIMLSDLRMMRLNDAINMAKDPNVLQIIGLTGLSKLIREYIELLIPDGSDIVPSDTDVLKEIEKHSKQMERMVAIREGQQQAQSTQQQPSGMGMPPAAERGEQVAAGV